VIYQHLIDNADKHGLLYRPDIVPRLSSRSSWARAIRSGVLTLDYPNVARLTSASRTIHQRIKAAHLACGRESIIAGPTAAWLHGVSLPEPDKIHVLSTNRLMNAHRFNLVLHRPIQLALIDQEIHDDIPATTPARTLFDVAAWSPTFLHRTFEHYLTTGDLTVRSTWRSLFQIARQGRPGITRVRNMLGQWSLDSEQPESVLEAKMLSLCYRAGFPPFEFQAQIGPYRVDFLWREQMAIVECDGFAFHGSTRDAFERDRTRDAYLQSLGFTVWRFSFRQLTFQQAEVLARLRTIFRCTV
jgi:very-short-patch-repair endonuclease